MTSTMAASMVSSTLAAHTPSATFDTNYCMYVNASCPVEATIYGYYPNMAGNVFFAVVFGICMIAQFALGWYYKTWTFMIALTLGCLSEVIGYAGRILLHNNPWSNTGFEMQICCLILAPAFIAAGIYLTLKHFTLSVSTAMSPLKPRLYTWIFICCDLLSLILQGAGGGTAATATEDPSKQKVGNDLMMAGIVWQVATLLVFGALVAIYTTRVYGFCKSKGSGVSALNAHARGVLRRGSFRGFIFAIVLAYLTIFTRCVYRIGEMANGWANKIMQDETDFMVLDGAMVAIATIALTIWHPGWAFPEMQARQYEVDDWANEKGTSDLESSPERGTAAADEAAEQGEKKKGGLFGRS